MSKLEIPLNKPLYVYQEPMFMLTVSTVLIVENGVIVLKETLESEQFKETPEFKQFATEDIREFYDFGGFGYKFPGGMVRASQETVQFSAVRYVKEQTGITLKKELLIPVDFRSSPDRSPEGNLVDIGFVCVLDKIMSDVPDYLFENTRAKWMEVNFEKKELLKDNKSINNELYMDYDILFQRAIDIVLMTK